MIFSDTLVIRLFVPIMAPRRLIHAGVGKIQHLPATLTFYSNWDKTQWLCVFPESPEYSTRSF